MSSDHRLSIDGLAVRYWRVQALHPLSLRATQGSVTVILGPNGAGKSTLVKAIAGLIPRCVGDIILHQRSLIRTREPTSGVR